MEKLRDIKGIVEVPDHSFYLLLLAIGIVVAVVVLLGIWVYRRNGRYKMPIKRKVALQQLKALDFSDTKRCVYDFTRLAHYAAPKRLKAQLDTVLKELEQYKFKKEVLQLDRSAVKRMKAFIREAERG